MIQSSNHESEDRHLKNVFKVSNMAGFYFDDFGRQNMKKMLGSLFVKSWGIIDEIANVIGFKPLFQKLTNNLT